MSYRCSSQPQEKPPPHLPLQCTRDPSHKSNNCLTKYFFLNILSTTQPCKCSLIVPCEEQIMSPLWKSLQKENQDGRITKKRKKTFFQFNMSAIVSDCSVIANKVLGELFSCLHILNNVWYKLDKCIQIKLQIQFHEWFLRLRLRCVPFCSTEIKYCIFRTISLF